MRIIRGKETEQLTQKENETTETSINSNHSMTKEIYTKINKYSSPNQSELDYFELLGNYYMHESYESCLRRYIYHSVCDNGKYEYCDEKGNVLAYEITREEDGNAYRWYYSALNKEHLNQQNIEKNPYLEILLLDAKKRGFSFGSPNESIKKRINRSFLSGYSSEDLNNLSKSYGEDHLGEIIDDVFPKGQSRKPQFAKFITDTSFILGLTPQNLDYFLRVVFFEETIKELDQIFALELIKKGHSNWLGYMASKSFQKAINNKEFKKKLKSIVTYLCEQINTRKLESSQIQALIQKEKERPKSMIKSYISSLTKVCKSVYNDKIILDEKFNNDLKDIFYKQIPSLIQVEKDYPTSMITEFTNLLTKVCKSVYSDKIILDEKFNNDLKDIFDNMPLLVENHIKQLVNLYCLNQEYKSQVEKIVEFELTTKDLIRISDYVDLYYKNRIQDSTQPDIIYKNSADDKLLNYRYANFRDYYVIPESEFKNLTRSDYERRIIKRRNILLLEFYKYCLSLDLALLSEDFTDDLVKTNIDGIDISIPAKVQSFIEKANDNLKKYGFVELSFKRYMDQTVLLAIWQDESPINFYMDNFIVIKDYLSEIDIEKLQKNEYIARASRSSITYSQKFYDALEKSVSKGIKLDDFLKKIKLNKDLLGEKRIVKIQKLYDSIKDKEGNTIHRK